MNKQSRQEQQFDEAAEQAKSEGVSSFGRANWTEALIAIYEDAAEKRGCIFKIIIGSNIGYFEEQ